MTADGKTAKVLYLRLSESTRKRLDEHTKNHNATKWPGVSQTQMVERMLVQALDAIDAAAKKAEASKQTAFKLDEKKRARKVKPLKTTPGLGAKRLKKIFSMGGK